MTYAFTKMDEEADSQLVMACTIRDCLHVRVLQSDSHAVQDTRRMANQELTHQYSAHFRLTWETYFILKETFPASWSVSSTFTQTGSP